MKNRIIALLICLSLICGALIPCFGESSKDDEIEIKNLYDYLMLENNCCIDRYSANKRFVLACDINLEGTTINGLASFSGTFDGRGYTISNFKFSNQSEACGLFRYIEESGIVSNLKVETNINSDNQSTIIGGIAGINYGVIDNCEFSGTLKSSKTLGGIVGSNARTGIIKNSINNATLISMEHIGGITGDNSGRIYACKNIGNINNESSWVDEQDDIDIDKLMDFNIDYQSGKNIGGIAGYNEGIIEDSCNDGTIGYFRSGDNIGGITGYHEGQIIGCVNNGSVFGKNDIGGIVGQMQPCINKKQSESLQPQLQQLHDILNKTIDDFSALSDTFGDGVSDFTKQADNALNTADALTDELINVTNENIDTLNDLSERIEYISKHLPSVTKEISASLTTLKTVTNDVKQIKDDAPVLTTEDQAKVNAALERIGNNADDLAVITSDAAFVYDKIYKILTDEDGGTRDFKDLSNDEKNKLRNLAKDLIKDLTDAGKIAADMIADLTSVGQIIRPYLDDSMTKWDKDLEKLSDDIDELILHLQQATDNTTIILDYCNSLDSLRATGFSNDFSEKANELNDTLKLLNSIIINLNNNTSANFKTFEKDMHAVNDQLNKVMNSAADYVNSLENLLNGDVYNDLSYYGRDYKYTTRITNCSNAGIIDGCKNIGGIAGNMDVEPISAIANSEVTIGHEYDVYAVIRGCSNTGFITVKNLYGGGIAGCSAKGYIYNCFSSGIIEGENASYLGGIAGISSLRIDSSNSMAELRGKEYVGGIAGNAEEIHGCLSIARITKYEGRSGAILGADIAKNTENDNIYRSTMTKRISGNYFCSSNLNGIDGVSYVNCAEPLSYNDLCSRENSPDEFKNLKIVFLNPDNKVVSEQQVKYGESLTDIKYPEIKSEPGKYVKWSGLSSNKVDGNILLKFEFLDCVTVVASSYTVSGRPAGYVGGNFQDTVKLIISTPFCAPPDFINSNALMHLYDVEISGSNINPSSSSTLRLYLGDANRGKAYIHKNNVWEEIQSNKNGSYLEIDMQGDHDVFCVAEINASNLKVFLACTAVAILIICIFVVIKGRKKGCEK